MDNLITKIREAFSSDKVEIEVIQNLLEEYQCNPIDWKEYVTFDPHKYTRNLIDTGDGKYNLMILCWGPGRGSSIHDHSNSHCFVKVLEGELLESTFAWPEKSETEDSEAKEEKPLKKISEKVFQKNAVSYMSDTLGLHRMENPSHSNPAISLHLYTPPYQRCQTFDERTSQCKEAFVLFDTSKDGEYNKRRKATQNNSVMDFNNNNKNERCCQKQFSTKPLKLTN